MEYAVQHGKPFFVACGQVGIRGPVQAWQTHHP